MKKLFMLVVGFALIISAVSAWGLMPGNGDGNPQFINLTEKTAVPEGAYPWVLDGGFGKLMYKTIPKPMFVFNAGNMTADTEYALISYAEPWGSTNNVLGNATSDANGNVTITGKFDVTTKFICNEYPTPTSDEYQVGGTKIWLVPAADLTIADGTAVFIAWNPSEYLFETDLVNKDCNIRIV